LVFIGREGSEGGDVSCEGAVSVDGFGVR
jgi:hypothetical protein